MRAEYRRPRDVLLSLVGEFIGRATTRLLDLNGSKGSGGSEGKPVELLDSKSHAVIRFFVLMYLLSSESISKKLGICYLNFSAFK